MLLHNKAKVKHHVELRVYTRFAKWHWRTVMADLQCYIFWCDAKIISAAQECICTVLNKAAKHSDHEKANQQNER